MLAVAVQIGYAAVVFFSSMVEKSGMSIYIIVAYRLMFAAVIAVTLALIFARGPMAQILLGESISLSSVTFGMALINLIPAMTFALAIAFRLDSLRMRTASGRAKLFGVVIGLCGGMLFTFYRGPRINTWSTHLDLLHLEKLRDNQEVMQPRKAKVSQGYQCQYSGTAIISTMAAIQAVIFALCHHRTDHSKWSLGWNARLIVTVSGVRDFLCIGKYFITFSFANTKIEKFINMEYFTS
ncbi:WAT1-related protein [Salix suchowensis]|nr:WAT1-related protein [Salix suchowensis]